MNEEIFISVDIETCGPVVAEFSMLSLGACVVGQVGESFYAELKPLNNKALPEALATNKLNLETLAAHGLDPAVAMNMFHAWIKKVSSGRTPVLVGLNACFDWSFVSWYFHKYIGENPFGFGAVDIKAYYMGLSGCAWGKTRSYHIPKQFQPQYTKTHNALDDARWQAEVFQKMLASPRIPVEES